MIESGTYQLEWIHKVEANLGKKKFDPKLIEKVIYALVFLEQLKVNGVDFIFKGGTALLLATEEPKRFSIDIDIITEQPQKEIETILEKISKESVFTHWEDDNERKHTSDAPIGHFKMYYISQVDAKEEPILLDILYTPNPYPKLMEIPIKHDWIQTSGKITTVQMPTFDAILGDKLTAFAPKTTGILYSKNRPVEVIKQLFDIGSLIDVIADVNLVRESYNRVVKEEIKFRKLEVSNTQVLDDTQEACYVLSTRDVKLEEFKQLQLGIRNFTNFTISRFNIDEAITAASKAAYLSEVLKNEKIVSMEKYKNPLQVRDYILEQPMETRLNKLKKSNPEAFFYFYKTLMLSSEMELKLSPKEIEALKTAIQFYKFRKNYPNDDIILSIQGKLNDEGEFVINQQELIYLSKMLDENINHVTQVEYPGLSQDFINNRKKEILEPLLEIKKKITNLTTT